MTDIAAIRKRAEDLSQFYEWSDEERAREHALLVDSVPAKCPNCGHDWSQRRWSGWWKCEKGGGGCGYSMTTEVDDPGNMRCRIRGLLREVDHLTAAAQNEATQRQKAEAERDEARAEGLALGKALQDATRENERLRTAGKDMIDAVLTGATIRDPITPTDIEAIDASKRFCALIGAELLREQKDEIAKLRSELEALRADNAAWKRQVEAQNDEHARVVKGIQKHAAVLETELAELRALLSSCRPVVEAVSAYQTAIKNKSADQAGKAMRQLVLLSLPTLPEKP